MPLNSTIDHKFDAEPQPAQPDGIHLGEHRRCGKRRAASSARSAPTAASCRRPTVRATRRTAPRRSASSTFASRATTATSTTITLENQTELTAKFDTGSVGHTLLMGVDLNYESYTNKASTRNGACNGVPPGGGLLRLRAGGLHARRRLALERSAACRATTRRRRPGAAGIYVNDTIQVHARGSSSSAACAGTSTTAQIGNSLNSVNTAGNTAAPYSSQTVHFTSVRTGAIFEPTPQQSYYVSYSTSFNPSLEQLTSTTGTTQSLPPENERGLSRPASNTSCFNGNLPLNGAVFQITKNNARTANADGTFTPTGTVRVKGARVGVAGQHHARTGRCSAATPT